MTQNSQSLFVQHPAMVSTRWGYDFVLIEMSFHRWNNSVRNGKLMFDPIGVGIARRYVGFYKHLNPSGSEIGFQKMVFVNRYDPNIEWFNANFPLTIAPRQWVQSTNFKKKSVWLNRYDPFISWFIRHCSINDCSYPEGMACL